VRWQTSNGAWAKIILFLKIIFVSVLVIFVDIASLAQENHFFIPKKQTSNGVSPQ